MTATLPDEVQRVFDRFVTTEFTAVDPEVLRYRKIAKQELAAIESRKVRAGSPAVS